MIVFIFFLNFILQKAPPIPKSTDYDYKNPFSYLSQVIPPTPDAIEEYNRSPLDISKLIDKNKCSNPF